MLFMINHCIPVLKLDAYFLHTRFSVAILKEIEKFSTDGQKYGWEWFIVLSFWALDDIDFRS